MQASAESSAGAGRTAHCSVSQEESGDWHVRRLAAAMRRRGSLRAS